MNLKIRDLESLIPVIQMLKNQNKTIVFTNGCFDILHAGHVQYLQDAKNAGDILVLGLNSDTSVSTIKGPKRPIVNEEQRAIVLAALSCVDYITIFNEPDPLMVIQQVLPHILVKGDDWAEQDIVGADIVKENGGKVMRIPLIGNISTTTIINRIIERE